YGGQSLQWRLTYQLEKMKAFGIDEGDLRSALGLTNLRVPLGRLDHATAGSGEQMGAVLRSPYQQDWQWQQLPVKVVDQRIVRLADVATVTHELPEPNSYYRINGKQTNNLVIYAQAGQNQIRLVQKLKKEIANIQTELPKGCSLLLLNDPTETMRLELDKIAWRTALTLLILLLFVLAVSRSWKYLWLIVVSLLANLAIAVIFYYLLGVEIHLYSIAGLTVSFGLLIDNSIIMIDHLRLKQNTRVFLAILASTLTTMAALGVVFFLSEKLQQNLVDFVSIVIINLVVSLLVALFFIPAFMQQLNFKKSTGTTTGSLSRKRRLVRFNRLYSRMISRLVRLKPLVLVVAILGFGLPVFLLPAKVEQEGFWAKTYNNTMGSEFYREHIKKPMDIALGGTLRLFLNKVDGSNYFHEKSETFLIVNVYMPEGALPSQMNEAVSRIEHYLQQYPQIRQFEARIDGGTNARVQISFHPQEEQGSFPYYLKDELTSFAIALGSADCQVYGVGDGFNNVMREQAGSYKVNLQGYAYDQLLAYANQLKDTLLQNPRIREVNISEKNSWYRDNSCHYALQADPEKLALQQNYISQVYQDLKTMSAHDEQAAQVKIDGRYKPVFISSSYHPRFNQWNLRNDLVTINHKKARVSSLGKIEKEKAMQGIIKKNQNYLLFLEYEFIGPYQLGHMHLEEVMENFTGNLPMGYQAEQMNRNWLNKEEKKEQNLSLLVIVVLIFFICAILFESLRQPLAILMIVPFTFIGLFLTYHFLDIGFNQGGYAAMILLAGLTVNAAIYIVNERNNISKNRNLPRFRVYLKAFNSKIIPILLTIISTILGLVPFLLDQQLDKFWYALVTGTMGGLLFSVVGLYFYLPLFFLRKKDIKFIKKHNT
ncbi:MAG: efflux RND transporter permease subunit, partial [Bacteroidota bacterium]